MDKKSLLFLKRFFFGLFICIGVYIFRFNLSYSWVWAIIYGALAGFLFVLLLLYLPIQIAYTLIANLQEEKFEFLNKKVEEINAEFEKRIILVSIHFGEKPWMTFDLLHVPHVGEKFSLSNKVKKSETETLAKVDANVLEKIEKGYIWTVEKVICYPHNYVTTFPSKSQRHFIEYVVINLV